MSEAAGIEDEVYDVTINFEGHPPEEIVLKQVAFGAVPTLFLAVSEDEGTVNFDIDAYGTGDLRGFLETVRAVIDNLIERDLEWKDYYEVADPEADG